MAIAEGDDVTKALVLQEYITRVYNESAGAITAVPGTPATFDPGQIGTELLAPVESDLKTEVDASDLVDLLRTHAYNLSRYRKATWIIDGNAFQAGTYLTDTLSRLNDSYRDNQVKFDDAALGSFSIRTPQTGSFEDTDGYIEVDTNLNTSQWYWVDPTLALIYTGTDVESQVTVDGAQYYRASQYETVSPGVTRYSIYKNKDYTSSEIETGEDLVADKMNEYIEKLRDIYLEVRDAGVEVHDCHGSCHNNCHNQCHSSRARR